MPVSLALPFPIPRTKVQNMINEYRSNLRPLSTASLKRRFPGRPDIEESKWSTVTVKEIQDFIAGNPGMDTIRIYFAAHDQSTMADVGFEMQGQLTTVLVPAITTTDTSGNQVITDMLNADSAQGAVNMLSYTGNGDDQYPLCPPHCPSGAAF